MAILPPRRPPPPNSIYQLTDWNLSISTRTGQGRARGAFQPSRRPRGEPPSCNGFSESDGERRRRRSPPHRRQRLQHQWQRRRRPDPVVVSVPAAAREVVRRAAGGQSGAWCGRESVSILGPCLLRPPYPTYTPQHTTTSQTQTKQLIPFPLPFSSQVLLGGRDRDFFTHGASVTEVCVYKYPPTFPNRV